MPSVEIVNPAQFGSTHTNLHRAKQFVRNGLAVLEDGKLRFLSGPGVEKEKAPSHFTEDERKSAHRMAQQPTRPLRGRGVYLLKSNCGLVKIGCSINLVKRMSGLSCVIPEDLELIGLIPYREQKVLESEMHKQYAGKRVKGEWFNLSEEDLIGITETYGLMVVNKKLSEFLRDATQN